MQELLGVLIDVEADQVVAQHPLENAAGGGALPERRRRRPRDVPEVRDGRPGGHRVPNHPRREREVVVLHPDDGLVRRVVGHRLGEALVDRPVPVEVGRPVLDQVGKAVTERPEHAITEPVVVGVDGFIREVQPAERIGPLIRRDGHAVPLVGHVEVSVAVAPGDPGPVGSLHDGIETRG